MSLPAPGPGLLPARFAPRYELLAELPLADERRHFQARDVAFAEPVALELLGPKCGLRKSGRRALEDAVRRAQNTPHPHLLRYHALDSIEGVLVYEWVHGVALLDLLRRSRALPAADAFTLLAGLPALLDFLARHEWPVPQPLLGQIFLEFPPEAAPDLIAEPVASWPPVGLKLNPLRLRTLLADAQSDSTRTVIRAVSESAPEEESAAPRALARLLYEVLGGRVRDMDAEQHSPLSALLEEGNAVLRRALFETPYATCHELWQDLVEAQGGSLRPLPPLSSAAPPAPRLWSKAGGAAQPGTVLRLLPLDPAAPPLHFVARPRFTLGRSLQLADFATRLLPETESNEALTNRMSRIHLVAENVRGRIFLRDGNGSGPSLNGTLLDARELSAEHAAPLPGRARLDLGQAYALELIPLARPGAPLPGDPPAALVCAPLEGQQPIVEGVWLLTEIGFGLDAAGRLVWDTRGSGGSPAAFHHRDGAFWLRNDSLPAAALRLGEAGLAPGKSAPLTAAQPLQMGSATFQIEIE